ncbi:putative ankyrin repeat protein [Acanthamoeba polyphaga mimivirus]|uniref:Putative ankyrin repeat protein n=1 Tax=Acanthamoeba polyphaga mimivirus TaxID=212035 RepID=A0A0G2Y6X3_MIMIV|nr:putative ankyrin repeat protein [Acanthamoeba polyphaga mimivirus]
MWNNLPVELWIHIISFAKNPVKLLTCSKFFLKFVPLLHCYNKIVHTKFKKNRSKNILKTAVENGYINVVKHIDNLKKKNSVLVQNPWIFGYDDCILFDICCKKGHLDLIKYIYCETVCNQYSKDIRIKIWGCHDLNDIKYLISAISHGHYDVFMYLLNNVVNIDCFQNKYVIHKTIKYRQLKIFRYLFKKALKKLRFYALKMACKYGSLKIVKFLVKKGAKIETDNYFAIDIALSNNHYRTAKYLLSTLLDVKIPVYWTWLDVMNDILGYYKDNNNIKNIMLRSNSKICDNSLVFLNIEETTYKNINELFIGQNLNSKQHKNIIDLYISNYKNKNKKNSDENLSREHLCHIIKHLMENMELDSIKYIISETKLDPFVTNFIHKQSLEINNFDTAIFL